jgi:hypothetical protein
MLRVLAAVFILLAPVSSRGDSVSVAMCVSAVVIGRAVVDSAVPAAVNVTATDVDRGYVELAEPITITVRTNSRRGYILQVNNISEAFSRVELTTTRSRMRVAREAWLERPYIAGGDVMTMRVRLQLAPGTVPGSYGLPIVFTASAL